MVYRSQAAEPSSAAGSHDPVHTRARELGLELTTSQRDGAAIQLTRMAELAGPLLAFPLPDGGLPSSDKPSA
jgi:hypothetical protein